VIGTPGIPVYSLPDVPSGPMKFHGPLELLLTANWNSTDVDDGADPCHVSELICAPLATPVSNVSESSVPVAEPATHEVTRSYCEVPQLDVLLQLKEIHPTTPFHAHPENTPVEGLMLTPQYDP
jgi:hypothetical protein